MEASGSESERAENVSLVAPPAVENCFKLERAGKAFEMELKHNDR